MAFPPGFLDELRSRVSLADLVGKRVRLTRRGPRVWRALPVPQREDAVLLRRRGQGVLPLLRLRRAWRRDRLRRCAPRTSTSSRRSSGWPARPGSRCRSRRRRSASGRSGRRRCSRRSPPPPSFYEAQLWSPAGARARDYLTRARARRGDDPPLPPRLGAGRPAGAAPRAVRRISRSRCCIEAGLLRVSDGGGDALRLFPRPGDLPDRRPRRPGHRLRRPHARRRPAEIPQLARHAALREGPGALRPGRRRGRISARDGDAGGARRHRHRRLYGRDRAAPRRVRHRGGAARHRADRDAARTNCGGCRPSRCCASTATRPASAPRCARCDRALPLLQPGTQPALCDAAAGRGPGLADPRRGPAAFAEVLAAARPLVGDAVAGRTRRAADRHARAPRRSRSAG